jgi:hypothetical protein
MSIRTLVQGVLSGDAQLSKLLVGLVNIRFTSGCCNRVLVKKNIRKKGECVAILYCSAWNTKMQFIYICSIEGVSAWVRHGCGNKWVVILVRGCGNRCVAKHLVECENHMWI